MEIGISNGGPIGRHPTVTGAREGKLCSVHLHFLGFGLFQ